MCGGSSRVSLGGLLAVIHPVPSPSSTSRRPSLKNCRLHLSNDGSDRTLSQLHFETDATLAGADAQRLEVRIHQSGQLSQYPPIGPVDEASSFNPVMHSFYVDRATSILATGAGDGATASAVLQRLNLGVGGTGVVGRTVSVLDEHQVVVGEGIIGWN